MTENTNPRDWVNFLAMLRRSPRENALTTEAEAIVAAELTSLPANLRQILDAYYLQRPSMGRIANRRTVRVIDASEICSRMAGRVAA